MHIPHDARILVADGAKMLFFRNRGDAERLDLEVIEAEQQPDPADRDIKTAPAGRMPGRNTAAEADFHDQAERRFAADAAAMLNAAALAASFDKLVVVASPRTLGELRKRYRPEVERRLLGEVAKDLTGHGADQIARLLEAAEAG